MKVKLIGFLICMVLIGNVFSISGQVIKNNLIRENNENNPLINGNKWIKTYGGLGSENGEMVQLSNDGCYIVAGEKWTGFGSSWVNDFWLIKINAMGDIIWDQIYGLDSYDWCSAVRQTSDDGFILVGLSDVAPNDNAIRLIKTDRYGAIEWIKTYLKGKVTGRPDVIQTSDDGYVIFASGSSWPERKDYIIRTDHYGDVIWEKNISYISQAWRGEKIKQTLDGGFIITGCADDESHSIGMKLIKLESDGNYLWNKTYEAKDGGLGFSVQLTNDGGFILCGHFSGGIGDYSGPWLIKTDSEGEVIWESKIGTSRYDFGYSVQQTIDNGYIVAGTYSPLLYRNPLLINHPGFLPSSKDIEVLDA